MEFVSPIVSMLGDDAGEAERDIALKIGFTVWNAVVYQDAIGEAEYINRLRKDLAGDAFASAIVENLIQRKRELFSEDYRLVGNYGFRYRHGELRFWVEARDPFPTDRPNGSRTRQ